jgi:predicted ATP-dependent serine protease
MMLWEGKSGCGKTTMQTQMMLNMARKGHLCLMVTLEQSTKSMYERIVRQALALDNHAPIPDLPKWLVKALDNIVLVDNIVSIDSTGRHTFSGTTPADIQREVEWLNTTRNRRVDVVMVDHLGILSPSPSAPKKVQTSELLLSDYIVKELAQVAKDSNVLLVTAYQVPKVVHPGVRFDYQVSAEAFVAYVLRVWRPSQQWGLLEEHRQKLHRQIKVEVSKNRFGPGGIVDLNLGRGYQIS